MMGCSTCFDRLSGVSCTTSALYVEKTRCAKTKRSIGQFHFDEDVDRPVRFCTGTEESCLTGIAAAREQLVTWTSHLWSIETVLDNNQPQLKTGIGLERVVGKSVLVNGNLACQTRRVVIQSDQWCTWSFFRKDRHLLGFPPDQKGSRNPAGGRLVLKRAAYQCESRFTTA